MTAFLVAALIVFVCWLTARISWMVTQYRIDQRWKGGTSERGL